jgi:hypothetical protein
MRKDKRKETGEKNKTSFSGKTGEIEFKKNMENDSRTT